MAMTAAKPTPTNRASGAPAMPEPGAILVLATTEPGGELLDELSRRHLDEETEVLVVAPALASRIGLWTDEDRWRLRAEKITQDTVEKLNAAGIRSRGWAGDADPLETLDDVLRTEDVREVIVTGSRLDCSSWLEHDALARAGRRFDVPVTLLAPSSADQACPWGEATRWSSRVAIVAIVGVVLAVVLALAGAGKFWLLGELGIVLGIVAVDLAAHVAVVGSVVWLAIGVTGRPRAAARSSTAK